MIDSALKKGMGLAQFRGNKLTRSAAYDRDDGGSVDRVDKKVCIFIFPATCGSVVVRLGRRSVATVEEDNMPLNDAVPLPF